MPLNTVTSSSPVRVFRFNPALLQYVWGMVLAALIPAFIFAYFLNQGSIAAIQWLTLAGCAAAVTFGFLSFRKLHLFPGSSSGYVLMSLSLAYAALAIVMLMLRLDYSRPQLVTSYLIAMVFFPLYQIAVVDRRRLRLGLVPGGRGNSAPEVKRIAWHRLESPQAPVAGLDAMVVDLRHDHSAEWSMRIADFALAGIPVYHAADAYELLTGRVEVHHLSENTLGSLNPNALYLRVKSAVDRVVALILLIALLPAFIILAIAIRFDSPGSAIFTQTRVGRRARPFRIFKLRTMIPIELMPSVADEDVYRQSITVDNDPRITRLGRFLRRYRIDELPQLLNILRGEMSFVGPRPEAFSLTAWYENEIPFYHYRHIIKPGLTGWAQVNQGHVAELHDIRGKLYLDFYYVKYFSPWLDALITLRTILIVLTGFGSK